MGFAEANKVAVADTVKKQLDAGLDVVSDGECAKPSYSACCVQRYNGFGLRDSPRAPPATDLADFLNFARRSSRVP